MLFEDYYSRNLVWLCFFLLIGVKVVDSFVYIIGDSSLSFASRGQHRILETPYYQFPLITKNDSPGNFLSHFQGSYFASSTSLCLSIEDILPVSICSLLLGFGIALFSLSPQIKRNDTEVKLLLSESQINENEDLVCADDAHSFSPSIQLEPELSKNSKNQHLESDTSNSTSSSYSTEVTPNALDAKESHNESNHAVCSPDLETKTFHETNHTTQPLNYSQGKDCLTLNNSPTLNQESTNSSTFLSATDAYLAGLSNTITSILRSTTNNYSEKNDTYQQLILGLNRSGTSQQDDQTIFQRKKPYTYASSRNQERQSDVEDTLNNIKRNYSYTDTDTEAHRLTTEKVTEPPTELSKHKLANNKAESLRRQQQEDMDMVKRYIAEKKKSLELQSFKDILDPFEREENIHDLINSNNINTTTKDSLEKECNFTNQETFPNSLNDTHDLKDNQNKEYKRKINKRVMFSKKHTKSKSTAISTKNKKVMVIKKLYIFISALFLVIARRLFLMS